jgi:hypothetical protein
MLMVFYVFKTKCNKFQKIREQSRCLIDIESNLRLILKNSAPLMRGVKTFRFTIFDRWSMKIATAQLL